MSIVIPPIFTDLGAVKLSNQLVWQYIRRSRAVIIVYIKLISPETTTTYLVYYLPSDELISFLVWSVIVFNLLVFWNTEYKYLFNELPHYEIRRPPDARQQRHV